MRELLITAVILAPCAREFLGVGADVAEVISGAEPGKIGLNRADSAIEVNRSWNCSPDDPKFLDLEQMTLQILLTGIAFGALESIIASK